MKKIHEVKEKTFGAYPERILQFGEGNFLRAFSDWMIDHANRDGIYKGSIVLCQPKNPEPNQIIKEQNGMYTLVMRGLENGQQMEKTEVITSVSRCINLYQEYDDFLALAKSPDLEVIISNTTEAGITYLSGIKKEDRPPASFPAKVTVFLHERFRAFHGDISKGLLFLPAELIDENGTELKRLVLQYANEWDLEPSFSEWVEKANEFTNTLVDRIVTGFPQNDISYFEKKLGYRDDLLVTSELFNLWIIEGKKEWADKLPLHKSNENVLWTNDVRPYKKRKVRILNGAHTATVLAAYLAGHNTVLDFMKDEAFRAFLESLISEEIIPSLSMPEEELKSFADSVSDRFSNPYIQHKLLDIALNSNAKFLARCLPSLCEYQEKYKRLPKRLTFSLAAFIRFYKVEKRENEYFSMRAENDFYPVRDAESVLSFFEKTWTEKNPSLVAKAVLSKTELWGGKDLSELPQLTEEVAFYLEKMENENTRDILATL